MSRINKKTLTAYLSWAIDRDITVEKWTTLSGGIHQNLHIYTRSNIGKQEYVIRVMPFARNNMLPYDMQTEYFALKDLEKVELSTPRVWGLDLAGQFLGQAVFAMEFVEGTSVLDAVSDSPKKIPRLFAEAIWKMNQVSPDQVPSVAIKDPNPQGISNPLSWVQNQLPLSQLPHLLTKAYDFLKREKPEKLPRKVFGNGDVGPQNFICRPENVIAIIDWEFVGFNDPLRELMLLHTWPEGKPFLKEYPIDRIYCEIAGIDPEILHWYEMLSNVSGWIYSFKGGQMNRAKIFESRLEEAL